MVGHWLIKIMLEETMRRFGLLSVALLCATLLAAPMAAAQSINWTLGDVDSASHWGPKSAQQLSEAVDKATGGKLKITVYPTESLFKGKDSLDAVSKNLAQIYRVAGFHVAGEAQILDQAIELAPLVAVFEEAQQVGGVDGNHRAAMVRKLDQAAAIGIDGNNLVHHRPGSGRAQGDHDVRLHDGELVVEPPAAGVDLARVRLLVDAPLALRLELEMLHRIGDENLASVDAGIGERAVKDAARRPHEWLAGPIFLVTRLLAHQHQPRAR
jgi:hypothetical protein